MCRSAWSRRPTGYEVALENAGANLFSIWNTDSNGNFQSYAVYSGTSTALESLETSFHQDLNGDRVIGIPASQQPSVVASASQAAPVMVASNDIFAFRPDLGASAVTNTKREHNYSSGPSSALTIKSRHLCRTPNHRRCLAMRAILHRPISSITTTCIGRAPTCIPAVSLFDNACLSYYSDPSLTRRR